MSIKMHNQEAVYSKAYYDVFIVGTVLTLLPSKMLAYLAPFVVVFWFIVRTRSGRIFSRVMLAMFFYMLVILAYSALHFSQHSTFLVGNAWVAFLTYGSFICLILLPGNIVSEEYSYPKYARILRKIILLQGGVGIVQYVIVAGTGLFHVLPGDAVQGTIGLFAFILESEGFGNQMFCINMVFFLLFYMPHVLTHREGYWVVAVGFLSIILAGVMHVFVSLMGAFFVTFLIFQGNIFSFKIIGSSVLIIGLTLSVQLFYPGIFKTTTMYLGLYQDQKSPKFEAINNVVYRLAEENPVVALVGLGPGQYSSRAGLMSSGEYFGSKTALLPNQTSESFERYFRSSWRVYGAKSDSYGNSTMHRPFFSLLSILAEFGRLGMGLYLLGSTYLLFRLRRFYTSPGETGTTGRYLSLAVGVTSLFLVFVSFFENYLETTQALLPGLMIAKFAYRYLMHSGKQANRTKRSMHLQLA